MDNFAQVRRIRLSSMNRSRSGPRCRRGIESEVQGLSFSGFDGEGDVRRELFLTPGRPSRLAPAGPEREERKARRLTYLAVLYLHAL